VNNLPKVVTQHCFKCPPLPEVGTGSPDGVAPSWMVILILPLHHKVHKFSSGTGSPRWSRKKGHKTVVMVVVPRVGFEPATY